MAPNRIISVFLPIFFSALVVCGIVLCTCALCHRPHYLTYFSFGRGRGNVDGSDITDSTGSSSSGTSSSDAEKGHGRGPSRPQKAAYAKQQKRGKSQKRPGGYGRVPQVMDRRTVRVDGPAREDINIVDADSNVSHPTAEEIDVVDAEHPDDRNKKSGGWFGGKP
ncbi:hypothetical protein BZA77DRAFT_352610 [Pyronema omphalodes]|nr:hypothetical protein BZA77DRAFT_352610 [Pyronema omphalodes]